MKIEDIKIDWDDIDPRHDWVAMDALGHWYSYIKKPSSSHNSGTWYCDGDDGDDDDDDFDLVDCDDYIDDWSTAILYRFGDVVNSDKPSTDGKLELVMGFRVYPLDTVVYVDVSDSNTIKRGRVHAHRYYMDDIQSYLSYEIDWDNNSDRDEAYEFVGEYSVFLTAEEAFSDHGV